MSTPARKHRRAAARRAAAAEPGPPFDYADLECISLIPAAGWHALATMPRERWTDFLRAVIWPALPVFADEALTRPVAGEPAAPQPPNVH